MDNSIKQTRLEMKQWGRVRKECENHTTLVDQKITTGMNSLQNDFTNE